MHLTAGTDSEQLKWRSIRWKKDEERIKTKEVIDKMYFIYSGLLLSFSLYPFYSV